MNWIIGILIGAAIGNFIVFFVLLGRHKELNEIQEALLDHKKHIHQLKLEVELIDDIIDKHKEKFDDLITRIDNNACYMKGVEDTFTEKINIINKKIEENSKVKNTKDLEEEIKKEVAKRVEKVNLQKNKKIQELEDYICQLEDAMEHLQDNVLVEKIKPSKNNDLKEFKKDPILLGHIYKGKTKDLENYYEGILFGTANAYKGIICERPAEVKTPAGDIFFPDDLSYLEDITPSNVLNLLNEK